MKVCRLDDIVPDTGVCALVAGEQVAVFRIRRRSIHAIGNRDPFSGANVLSRGIVGDLKGELVVASPVYKQHFSLATGRCVEDPEVRIPVYDATIEDGMVVVEPAREVATTCCYCGVGCGVLASVSRNEIFSVRGDPSHPANFGRLCTKGLSLHKADPSFRGLYPEVNDRTRQLGRGSRPCGREIPRSHQSTWPRRGGVLHLRPAADRGLLRLQQARQGPDRHQQRRHQLAPVHGLRGGGLQADARRRRAACVLRGHRRTRECVFIAGSQHRVRAPGPVPPHRGRKRANPDARDRRRPAPHRDRARRRPAPAIQPGTDVALFNGMLHVHAVGGLVRPRLHRGAHRGLRRAARPRARLHAGDAAAVCGMPAKTSSRRRAGSRGCRAPTLSLYCQGLNQSRQRHRQERGADQPAPRHRPDRQARRGAVLAHRPAQRDGRARSRRHGEPAFGAPRPRATPEHRAEVARAVGRAERSGTAGQDRGRDVRGDPPTARSRRSGSPAPIRRSRCPTRTLVREALERAEFVVVQEAFRDTETCAYADVLLPATTWGEKEGTVTNSRAPHLARARRACARPGEARADWAIAVDFARRLELGPARRRRLFPYDDAEAIFNEHRETTRGRDLDITGLSLRAAGRARPAAVAVSARRASAAASASTTTASSPRRRAARASSPTAVPAGGRSGATRVIRCASPPAACATSGTA